MMIFPPHSAHAEQDELVLTPQKFLDYRKSVGRYPTYAAPETMILCYNDTLMKQILGTYPHTQCDGILHKVYFLKEYPKVGVTNLGVGAANAVLRMEIMIAWGVKRFIALGSAGGLQGDLKIGDIVLCDKALCGDGISSHYSTEKVSYPDPELNESLARALDTMGMPYRLGASWTNEAFFRTKREDLLRHEKDGVLCVEMEAAALFAAAEAHGVSVASLFTISDSLSSGEWRPAFDDPHYRTRMQTLVEAALLSQK